MSIVLGACAFAPFKSTNTARSLGDKKWGMDAGFSPATYVTAAYGVSENFDLGLVVEEQIAPLIGIWGQYSFINNKEKGALALHGGVSKGTGVMGSSAFYIGPIVSFKKNWFETYLNVRYNYVDFKAADLSGDDLADFILEGFTQGHLSYVQSTFGFNFWFSEKVAMDLNVKHIYLLGDGASVDNSLVPGLGMNFRF
jgi:hypothetical protein